MISTILMVKGHKYSNEMQGNTMTVQFREINPVCYVTNLAKMTSHSLIFDCASDEWDDVSLSSSSIYVVLEERSSSSISI